MASRTTMEQIVAIADMPVDGRGSHPDVGRHLAHAERLDAAGLDQETPGFDETAAHSPILGPRHPPAWLARGAGFAGSTAVGAPRVHLVKRS